MFKVKNKKYCITFRE